MSRFIVAPVLALMAACGPIAATTPTATTSGGALTVPQLKLAVLAATGTLRFCDPDYYPIARLGGEEANARQFYPQIVADTASYRAILTKEHLRDPLTEAQKLTVYQDWKQLRAITLVPEGDGASSFTITVTTPEPNTTPVEVTGSVTSAGAVNVASRRPGHVNCPICLAFGSRIDTPRGAIAVEDLRFGDLVYSRDAHGRRTAVPIVRTGSVVAPDTHEIVVLRLAGDRTVRVSPGHPTADGRRVGELRPGDSYDGAVVVSADRQGYGARRTYDILPAGATGYYWADGILLGSTLSA